ncbi:MAG: hypothetical protein WC702_00480 [Patescibacteria group bacterium]|jgi:hypothetical protein
MFLRLATFFLTLTFLVAAASPTVVLAQTKVSHGCHKEPVEMPVACAVHCLDNAINEDEVVFDLTSGFEFIAPVIVKEITELQFFSVLPPTFEEAEVFRDPRVILSIIKRE